MADRSWRPVGINREQQIRGQRRSHEAQRAMRNRPAKVEVDWDRALARLQVILDDMYRDD